MLIERNISLRAYNTFGVEVTADYLTHIATTTDLEKVFTSSKFKLMKKLVLGGGSNVLFTRHFAGLIIKIEIHGMEVIDDSEQAVLVKIGAGENWHQFVLWAVERNLGGIENLSLIPGTVGAAPIQNIGAYGVEQESVFHSLEAYEITTGEIVRFYKEDCKFGYRNSIFKSSQKDNYIITRVYYQLRRNPEFNLSYGNLQDTLNSMGVNEPSLKSISQAVINIRQSKLPDPAQVGNAGSFFKNPVIKDEHYQLLKAAFEDIPGYKQNNDSYKVPAAWLIEQAGWKGFVRDEVGVHHKQPLVLVNHGNGSGKQISELSQEVRKSVFEQFGIELEPEVNII